MTMRERYCTVGIHYWLTEQPTFPPGWLEPGQVSVNRRLDELCPEHDGLPLNYWSEPVWSSSVTSSPSSSPSPPLEPPTLEALDRLRQRAARLDPALYWLPLEELVEEIAQRCERAEEALEELKIRGKARRRTVRGGDS